MTAFVPALTTKSTYRRQTPTLAAAGAPFFEQQQPLTTNQVYSSFLVADNQQPSVTLPSGQAFEPILPDTTTLLAFASIVVLSVAAAWVWQTQVVPVSRTNLALSKKRGPVKEYLDELRAASELHKTSGTTEAVQQQTTIHVNATTSSQTNRLHHDGDIANVSTIASTTTNTTEPQQRQANTRTLERWLFTDWLQKGSLGSTSKPGRQKEPALPVLKNAKWNSGDNPVLVASALIMAGVIFTAVTERVANIVF